MDQAIYNYGALLTYILSFTVNFVFFILIVGKLRSTKVKALQLLLLTSLLDVLVESISIYLAVSNIESFFSQYLETGTLIFNLLGILTAGAFLIFIDYFESSSFKSYNIIFFLLTLVLHSTFVVIIQTFPDNYLTQINSSYLPIFNIYLAIGSLILPIFLAYVLISSIHSIQVVKKYALNNEQIRQLNLMITVIGFYFFITLLSNFIANMIYGSILSSDVSITQFLMIFLIPKTSTIIGTIILLFAYVRSKNVAFLQPQRVLQLMVINNIGLPVYSYKFREKETDSMLFSGGVTAINSMLKETIGLETEIELIRFSDLDIMVARKNQIGVFIIVEKSSKFIKEAMKNFLESFSEKFKSILNESIVNVENFSSADELVKHAFGLT